MATALCNTVLHSKLFPNGYIVIDWVPFNASYRGNIAIIERMVQMGKLNAMGVTNLDEGETSRSQLSSLTFCSPMHSSKGFRLNIDYFGDEEDDFIHQTLLHICREGKQNWAYGEFGVKLYFPESLSVQRVLALCNAVAGIQASVVSVPDGSRALQCHVATALVSELDTYRNQRAKL